MQVKKKLLDLVRDKIRFKHYSYSTERTCVHWIKHPIEMGKLEIEQYHRRHHVHQQTLGRNIKVAAQKANLNKRVTSHIFRHSYATHRFLISI